MSRAKRAQMQVADCFDPKNGWRALGLVMALALGYNGVAVGVEYRGVPLAPFLSSSLELLMWSNLAWSALFLAVSIVAALTEVANSDPAWRCAVQAALLACFCLAGLAVTFSDNPPLTSGRYWLGAFGSLLAFLASARAERLEQAEELLALQGAPNGR